jgi:hypothetical protein
MLRASVIALSVGLFSASIARGQTYEPRPFPRALAAANTAPPEEPALLPQAGIEAGTLKTTINVEAIQLHVKGHKDIKFLIVSGIPAVTETPEAGQTISSKPSDRLQRALMDAAGGIANFSFAKQFSREFYQVDARASGKLIEVPDALIHGHDSSGSENLDGFTIRPIVGGSVRLEGRVPLEYENNEPAGVLFFNATGAYNFLQDDIVNRFQTALDHQNFSLTGAAGLDLPAAHFYVAFVFSVYSTEGQFDHRYAVTFNPHR